VALSGNYVGKTPQALAAMTQDQIEPLRQAASEKLHTAGADHVIDTIADLPDLVRRLSH
jgi:phosphonoacetaldehyde hydrolase